MNSIEVEIGGKLRKFRFGLAFLGDILEYLNTDIAGFGSMLSTNPYKAIPAIIYFGHAYEVKKAGKQVDFTLLDVSEWVEELEGTYSNKVVEDLLEVLLEAMKKNVPGLKELAEADKKK